MAELPIESHLQDLHLTPQTSTNLAQMNKSQIRSHLQDWAVENEGYYGSFCSFSYTKGPFIQFCANIDQGHVYFAADIMMERGEPTDLWGYDLPQPMRAKIVQAFKKTATTHELKVYHRKECDAYTIGDVKNVETLVECVCAVMDAVDDTYGEIEFELF